jgi:hypothetical protein
MGEGAPQMIQPANSRGMLVEVVGLPAMGVSSPRWAMDDGACEGSPTLADRLDGMWCIEHVFHSTFREPFRST